MSEDKPKAQTIKELEDELKLKQKQLESPFAVVGAGQSNPRPRGRPPGSTNKPKYDAAIGGDESNAIQVAHSQRMAEITRPAPNSSPESVRDWAEKEIHNLLPEAVASLAWDIKYGDNKARTEARGEILRATGIDKKDAASFGKGGQIVINVAGATGGIQLPYLQRAPNSEPSSPMVQTLESDASKKGK